MFRIWQNQGMRSHHKSIFDGKIPTLRPFREQMSNIYTQNKDFFDKNIFICGKMIIFAPSMNIQVRLTAQ